MCDFHRTYPRFTSSVELNDFMRVGKLLATITHMVYTGDFGVVLLQFPEHDEIESIMSRYSSVKDAWMEHAKKLMVIAFREHDFGDARKFYLILHFLEMGLSASMFGHCAWGAVGSEEIFLRALHERPDACICVQQMDPLFEGYQPGTPIESMQYEEHPRCYGGGMCFHCLKMAEEPHICGRCKQISYCGEECQRADYSGHKKYCHLGERRPTWWGRSKMSSDPRNQSLPQVE